MDWKEFFRPKWNKVIVAVVLFLVILIIYSYFDGLYSCMCGYLCPSETVDYRAPFECCGNCMSQSKAILLTIFQKCSIYLGEVVLAYCLSCLIFIKSALKKK